MYSRLLSHVQRHFGSYKHLVIGSAAAAIVGAVAAIVYDHLAPHPWDVYVQEQQQAIQAAAAKLQQALEPIPAAPIEAGNSSPKQRYHRVERTSS
ncbi:hypothetical protein [Achromobacter dolens]|uniref:hypothetical protein n=1 Tax=Achromobacter dolens TaxID=1287738 RepID=UPI003559308E